MKSNKMSDVGDKIIRADPSKEFFIDMLTKDITLSECILDLLDNSIHSLICSTGLDVMNMLEDKPFVSDGIDAAVNIKFSPTKFTIEDNCGGITIEDARDSVFRLGNPNPDKTHSGLGVYGIGMKRAMFKIGTMIKVESRTEDEEFAVIIDVKKWKAADLWDLTFDYARKKRSGKHPGTKIEITSLHDSAKRNFKGESFRLTLEQKISAAFALFLKAGVKIHVGGIRINPRFPDFAESTKIRSAKKKFKVKGVEVLVMAGLSPPSDKEPRGWYVCCNGRMVLEADKTYLTGWGDVFPQYHTKYNHFLGLVYFKSKDGSKLPWTTTKEGVERESEIYQRALQEMQIIGRPVTAFLNKMYPSDVKAEGVAEREALENTKAVSVTDVAKKTKRSALFKADTVEKSGDELVTISYKRSKKSIERIKHAIKKTRMSATKVGEHTFDTFLRRECK